jgi:chromate transporter
MEMQEKMQTDGLVLTADLEVRPKPSSLWELFSSFTLMAMQGFGGVAPILQRVLVEEKRWMTKEEFIEDWSVAQLSPGPNVVNVIVMFGGRHFGIAGSLAALSGLIMLPSIIVVFIALAYLNLANHPGVEGAMRGISAVVAGMFAAMGLKLGTTLKKNILSIPVCISLGVTCFVMVALLRMPLMYALLGPGLAACLLAYRKMTR